MDSTLNTNWFSRPNWVNMTNPAILVDDRQPHWQFSALSKIGFTVNKRRLETADLVWAVPYGTAFAAHGVSASKGCSHLQRSIVSYPTPNMLPGFRGFRIPLLPSLQDFLRSAVPQRQALHGPRSKPRTSVMMIKAQLMFDGTFHPVSFQIQVIGDCAKLVRQRHNLIVPFQRGHDSILKKASGPQAAFLSPRNQAPCTSAGC